MKYTKYIISIVFIVLTLYSCTNNRNDMIDKSLIYLECTNCSEEPSLEYPSYEIKKIIALETDSNCLLGEPQFIKMCDSFLVVSDINNNLFSFDLNGKLLSKIGKLGLGPNEYNTISSFYLDNDKNINVVDDIKNEIIKYDCRGKYIISSKVSRSLIRRNRDGLLTKRNFLLLYTMMNFEENMNYTLINMDSAKLLGQYYPYKPLKPTDYIYSFSTHPMAQTKNGIDFITPLCDTIYNYSSCFSPKYVVGIPKKMAPKKKIGKSSSFEPYPKKLNDLEKKGFFSGFTALFETDDYVFLEYLQQGAINGYFLFNKKTNKGSYHLYFINDNSLKFPFFDIIDSNDSTLIGMAKADQFIDLNPKISISNKSMNSSYKKILRNIKSDDNPILVFYKINQDDAL